MFVSTIHSTSYVITVPPVHVQWSLAVELQGLSYRVVLPGLQHRVVLLNQSLQPPVSEGLKLRLGLMDGQVSEGLGLIDGCIITERCM